MPRSHVATLAVATLLMASSAVAFAQSAPVPSLSQRLSSLQKRWASEEEHAAAVQTVSHTEGNPEATRSAPRGPINQQPPNRTSGGLLSRDLFSALRGDDQGEASVPNADSRPSEPIRVAHGDSRPARHSTSPPRAGSAFIEAPPTTPDLGTALATPTEPATPEPAAASPAPPTTSAARRPYAASGQSKLELITSSAGSAETRSASSEAPRVALNSPSTEVFPRSGTYATAADAARALAGETPSPSFYDATSNTGTTSPSDIPATVSPLLESRPQRPDRYADSDVTPQPQEGPSATSATSTIDLPATVEPHSNSRDDKATALQPDWDAAKANPMRSSDRPTPTPASPGLSRGNVLVEQRLPVVTTQVTGPSEILIGREANYRVTIQNRGTAATDSLIAEVTVPEWADVVHSKANAGAVRQGASDAAGTQLRWEINSLDTGATQVLELTLIPRTSQPLELGVTWRQAPVAATTRVVVQEPKLAIAISGPEEVFFGRPQSYRLTISNPGTGTAEKVVVQLMPPGGGQAVSSHRLESLAPGEAKMVEVEITAREAGELSVSAMATADGGLQCEAAQPIFCRKPELQVDWRGPARKFAGTEGTWFFRVRNPGTAPADEVEFEVSLPAGFQFASASEGHRHDQGARRVAWRVGTLRPGDDCYLELRGVMNQPGGNTLSLTAATPGKDIQHSATAMTEVVALADLKLEVSDPKGPVAVGAEIEYEIVVNNRGLSPAEDVQIAGFFSAGVEPVAVNGGEAQIADGRVTLRPIASLPPGQQVRIKIRAKGLMAGTHLFRAEVLCRDSEIKLAAEETTRYFADDSTASNGNDSLDSASRASRFEQMR